MSSSKAIIISAPSGSGKTTIVRHLLEAIPKLRFSVSATSRPPRKGEKHGHHYYFLSRSEFEAHIDAGDFVEWEEVYDGIYYGTLKSEIERIWSEGDHVIFDVDVKGGLNLKTYFGEAALSVFITVRDLEELEKRLRGRGTESGESLQKRIEKASYEMSFKDRFDRIVLNEKLGKAVEETVNLVNSFIKS